jgi:hypothetical protein
MKEDSVTESTSLEEPFLSRWSRLKQASEDTQALEIPIDTPKETPIEEAAEAAPSALTDADMPPLESLDENSDYEGFLSPEVSEALRQQALSKLFRSACFNVCDGLDDYAEDFTQFEKLGDVMTADLRHRLQQEAKRIAETAKSETAKTESPQTADSDLEPAPTSQQAQEGEVLAQIPANPAEENDLLETDKNEGVS